MLFALSQQAPGNMYNNDQSPDDKDGTRATPVLLPASMTASPGDMCKNGKARGGDRSESSSDKSETQSSLTPSQKEAETSSVSTDDSLSFFPAERDEVAPSEEVLLSTPLPVPPISATKIMENADKNPSYGRLLDSHDLNYFDPDSLQVLEAGGALYSFSCSHELSPFETDMVDHVINLSAFEDETRDNYVPHFDVKSESEEHHYTFLLAQCAYCLPGVNLASLADPQFASSVEYHSACQPSGTVIWTDGTEECTFRITKPVVPYLYSLTVQFRVSQIDDEDLARLSRLYGMQIHAGLLLERTKRSVPPKEDGTKKAKSVLLYTKVDGGILVTHSTVILQTVLPDVVEKVIDRFGCWGLSEANETADRTRRYLREVIPTPSSSFDLVPDSGKEETPTIQLGDAVPLGTVGSKESDVFYDAQDCQAK